MAQMRNTVITQKGQALMAKLIAGTAVASFTKISTSSTTYSQTQLESLTALSNVQQTTLVSRVARTNAATVSVEGAITNIELSTGYYLRAVGLYAMDPQEGEILYSVTIAETPDYVPAYNGLTSTGIFLKLLTSVSNSANVSIDVDPAAVATVEDVRRIEAVMDEHLDSDKPHLVYDITKNKKYRIGLEIADGQPRIIYEEEA